MTPGSIVAVISCGGVGQSVIQGARISGASTIAEVAAGHEAHAIAVQLADAVELRLPLFGVARRRDRFVGDAAWRGLPVDQAHAQAQSPITPLSPARGVGLGLGGFVCIDQAANELGELS